MTVGGFPFGTVTGRLPEEAAAAGTDINTYALAYQMMRDAKALPSRRQVCAQGKVVSLASNTRRVTPMFVRVRAALVNSVGRPFLYLGTDATQTEAGAVLDRIGDGGLIEFLLYPGQELFGCYIGDDESEGDAFVSIASFDEALVQAKRATGQAT